MVRRVGNSPAIRAEVPSRARALGCSGTLVACGLARLREERVDAQLQRRPEEADVCLTVASRATTEHPHDLLPAHLVEIIR